MAPYSPQQIESLRQRWGGQRDALRHLVARMKEDEHWFSSPAFDALMVGLGPLPVGLEPVEVDLRGANLAEADLAGVHLEAVDLAGAILDEADLRGAQLVEANLQDANLWTTDLRGANLWEARLAGADMRFARLAGANLVETDLRGANLWGADLAGANLEKADLADTALDEVVYTTDEVWDRLARYWLPVLGRRIPGLKKRLKAPAGVTHFEQLDTARIDFSRNAFLKRYIEDYQFIQAVKQRGGLYRWVLYPLWKASSDCGRSMGLWLLWAALTVVGFALLYGAGLGTGGAGLWRNVLPRIALDTGQYRHDLWSPLYFSLATFTTSGFYGGAQLLNGAALFWTSLEVGLGYIMLGGLISIFANKLARRA